MELLKRLMRDEEGQGLVEYALIVALIAIACVAAVGALGDKLNEVWEKITGDLATS